MTRRGPRRRNGADRLRSLTFFLFQCRPEKLATYSDDDLARMHGVPVGKVTAMRANIKGGHRG